MSVAVAEAEVTTVSPTVSPQVSPTAKQLKAAYAAGVKARQNRGGQGFRLA